MGFLLLLILLLSVPALPQRVDQLTTAGTLSGDELFYLQQNSHDRKLTLGRLLGALAATGDADSLGVKYLIGDSLAAFRINYLNYSTPEEYGADTLANDSSAIYNAIINRGNKTVLLRNDYTISGRINVNLNGGDLKLLCGASASVTSSAAPQEFASPLDATYYNDSTAHILIRNGGTIDVYGLRLIVTNADSVTGGDNALGLIRNDKVYLTCLDITGAGYDNVYVRGANLLNIVGCELDSAMFGGIHIREIKNYEIHGNYIHDIGVIHDYVGIDAYASGYGIGLGGRWGVVGDEVGNRNGKIFGNTINRIYRTAISGHGTINLNIFDNIIVGFGSAAITPINEGGNQTFYESFNTNTIITGNTIENDSAWFHNTGIDTSYFSPVRAIWVGAYDYADVGIYEHLTNPTGSIIVADNILRNMHLPTRDTATYGDDGNGTNKYFWAGILCNVNDSYLYSYNPYGAAPEMMISPLQPDALTDKLIDGKPGKVVDTKKPQIIKSKKYKTIGGIDIDIPTNPFFPYSQVEIDLNAPQVLPETVVESLTDSVNITSVKITGNTVTGCDRTHYAPIIVTGTDSSRTNNPENVDIANNDIEGSGSYGILVLDGKYVDISDNGVAGFNYPILATVPYTASNNRLNGVNVADVKMPRDYFNYFKYAGRWAGSIITGAEDSVAVELGKVDLAPSVNGYGGQVVEVNIIATTYYPDYISKFTGMATAGYDIDTSYTTYGDTLAIVQQSFRPGNTSGIVRPIISWHNVSDRIYVLYAQLKQPYTNYFIEVKWTGQTPFFVSDTVAVDTTGGYDLIASGDVEDGTRFWRDHTYDKVWSGNLDMGGYDIHNVDSLEVTGTASIDTIYNTYLQTTNNIISTAGGFVAKNGGVIFTGRIDDWIADSYGSNGASLSYYSGSVQTGLLLNNLGNVGIGTSSPTEKLEVNGNILADTLKGFKADTLSYSWGIMDTVTVGDLPGWKVPSDITIIEISAYTDANTTTFNLEERGETTPNTPDSDIMAADLVADNNQQEQTSFSDASISKDSWLVPTVSATGDVSIFSITVRYVKVY